jgi:ABC-type phosphate transport system substrate-binding protein
LAAHDSFAELVTGASGTLPLELFGDLREAVNQQHAMSGVPELPLATESDSATVGRFCDNDDPFMALVVRDAPDFHARSSLQRRFPSRSPQPGVFTVGQRRIAVIVNGRNRDSGMTLPQLGSLLAQSDHQERPAAGGGTSRVSVIYDEGAAPGFRDLLREKCMGYSVEESGSTLHDFHAFRDDIRSLADGDAVIEHVRRDPNGLGLFWYRGQDLKGVKLLEIAPDEGAAGVALATQPKIQEDYPLAEPLMLFVHPKAPKELWEFGRFCTGPVAAEIVARHGFTTPHHVREHAANDRVKRFLDGEGEKITAIGPSAIRGLMPDLASEYARAKEPAQLSFKGVTSDTAAVAAFGSERSGRPEMLFLTSRPTDKVLGAHAEAWNQLAPTEHVLAGRATAVIVNAANKLDSLPQETIEAILGGETNDWEVIGGTELPVPDRRQGAAGIPINRFATRGHDAAALLTHGDRRRTKLGRHTLLPDTKAVVAAVSLDPLGIGLVNVAELPRTGQTIKVLGIQIAAPGPGQPAPIIRPTAETIRDETYPYAERLFVYVARAEQGVPPNVLAEFIATCGGSEVSAESDPVRHVMSVYQKHGWLPLADAARQREIEDARAEAAANATQPKASKGKRK